MSIRVGRERPQLGKDAVLEEQRTELNQGRGQVNGVVLDWVQEGVVHPVRAPRGAGSAAYEEVEHLRTQV